MEAVPDAERVQEEREERRAAERRRFEASRRSRESLVNRWRAGNSPDPRVPRTPRPRRTAVPAPPTDAVPATASRSASRAQEAAGTGQPRRPIGGPIVPDLLRPFLELDGAERFDLQALNALSLASVGRATGSDPELATAVARHAEILLTRVRREVDDPLTVGSFVREQLRRWYAESATRDDWTGATAPAWAGLFADSKIAGGRLEPWIVSRLRSLSEASARGRPIASRLRRVVGKDRRARSDARGVAQQIQGEAAQAILDDVAQQRRTGPGPFPLVRLSELAVRRQVPTINEALAALLSSPEGGPFVVLHPNRYPGCEEVEIRPPAGNATGAVLAYLLVVGKGGRRGGPRSGHASGADGEGEPGAGEVDGASIWEADRASTEMWKAVVTEYAKDRRRLESPPKEFRSRSAFDALRGVLLEDPAFRKTFLAVRWRGRPAGPALLAVLLQNGSLSPEVATDHEYLEAELGSLAGDGPAGHPAPGTWKFGKWTVSREAGPDQTVRYVATEAAT